MEMTCAIREGVNIITLRGRLDIDGTGKVEEAFQTVATESQLPVAVDLSGVEFISSMGLRMLLTTAHKLHGLKLRLAVFAAQWQVRESLDTAGLGQLIPSAKTEAEARELLAKPSPL